ncbi:hypothetical protein I317_03474 [Kwoniella heveanensis CBS 569]|nr:hypothetical protein I317_03474 [Kwoniella heveanensis CBS 569]
MSNQSKSSAASRLAGSPRSRPALLPEPNLASTPPPTSTTPVHLSSPSPVQTLSSPPAAGPAPDVPGSIFRHVPTIDEKNATTLLPRHISQLITGIATSTRMSLRISAFLVEAILESSRYSTKMSLGYTRQMLISAIWAARGMYHLTNDDLNLNPLEILAGSVTIPSHGGEDKDAIASADTDDAFLSIFNKYTNLGVYLIHHTFTLAELFSMSGFFITTGAIKTVHQAASESVAIFDGLFGSSESSRALSAIITMVRREVLHDERRGDMGVIASLTGLTKALTAFACLQAATWERTSKRLKLKVLYDCIILAEEVNAYTTSQKQKEAPSAVKMMKPSPRSLTSSTATTAATIAETNTETCASQADVPPLSPTAMMLTEGTGGPGPSTMKARLDSDMSHLQFTPPLDEANLKLAAHLETAQGRSTMPQGNDDDKSDWSMDDLQDIVGESGDEMYEGPPDEVSREEHRRARKLEVTDELRQSTVISQILRQVRRDESRSRAIPLHRRQLSLPEFTSTLHLTRADTEQGIDMDRNEDNVPESCTDAARPGSAFSMLSATDDSREDDHDWIEVDQLLRDEGQNSTPVTRSIGSSAYLDALEHPHHNMERIKVVLQTATHKFEERKRTVKHIPARQEAEVSKTPSDDGDEDIIMIPESQGAECSAGPRSRRRLVEWDRNRTRRPSEERLDSSRIKTGSPTPRLRGSSLSRSMSNPALSRRTISPLTPSTPLTPSRTPISPRSSRETETSTPTGPRHTSASPLRRRKPPPISLTPHSEALASNVGAKAPPPSPCDSVVLPQSPAITIGQIGQAGPGSDDCHLKPDNAQVAPGGTNKVGTNPLSLLSSNSSTPTQSQPRSQVVVPGRIPSLDPGSPDNLFPHEGLIRNIHRFMKFSSAAYGQNFLRILGMGQPEGPFPHLTKRGKHHANSWSFAEHVNIPIDCILLSSFTEPPAALVQQEAPPLVHYVAVIHEARAIALTCRGTLGLSDLLVDLTCEYESIDLGEGDRDAHYYVHSGMWQSARKLTVKQSTVHEVLLKALTQYPDYGLVLAGHSLGGGVASLLGILCSMPAETFLEQNATRQQPFAHPPITTPFVTNISSGLPPGRPIHVYAYGPPAVASPDLASYASGLITSVVQDTDIVPTLSLGGVKDFKNISLTLSEEGNVAEEIVGRVIGANKRKFKQQSAQQTKGGNGSGSGTAPTAEEVSEAEALSDWMVSLIKTMRADMDNDKLYPAGTVYIMEHFDIVVPGQVVQRPLAGAAGQSEKTGTTKKAHRIVSDQTPLCI